LVAEHTQRLTEAKLAEAELEQSKHALKAARAGQTAVVALIREADAAIKRTMANQERWRSENRRVAGLVKDRVLDQQTSEEIGNQARAAEAHHEEALARLETAGRARDKADADVVHAEGAVLTAAAKLDVARAIAARTATYLEFRSVRAPFDGVITKRSCSPGESLEVGSSPPLFTVARIDPARAVAYLPETLAARLETNREVVIRFPGGGAPDMKAKISRTGWALDTTSRTLRMEADLPNPAPHPVRVGAYIKMVLPLVWSEARVLPKSAVMRQQDQSVAFVARSGKARRVVVETGGADDKNIEIRSANLAGELLDLTQPVEFIAPAVGRTEGDPVPE
jgi:multidrug efflux pump subunit AcrA (membrane-fusion protein)